MLPFSAARRFVSASGPLPAFRSLDACAYTELYTHTHMRTQAFALPLPLPLPLPHRWMLPDRPASLITSRQA